jgi:hypothetical protein
MKKTNQYKKGFNKLWQITEKIAIRIGILGDRF